MVLSLFFLAATAMAQDIAQWRGKNRDGIFNETGLLKKWPDAGPKLLWHFDQLGDGHSSAAIYNNRVYTSGMIDSMGYVFSFDMDGKLLWKALYGREWAENWPGARTTPAINDGKVYIESGYGVVVCLDASSGKILWKVDLIKEYGALNIVWGMTENLVIDGNRLFCTPGGPDANVIALDKNTGKLLWKSKANGEKSAYGSPALISLPQIKILVVMTEKSIQGIDANSGALLWSHEQTNQWSVHPNTPVFKNGLLYCLSGYGKGGVMLQVSPDGKSIKELWRNASLDSRLGGAVMMNGKIYGSGDKTKKLQCIDQKTGALIYSVSNLAPANIISAEGLLYLYAESGIVALVEPQVDNFNIISSFKVPYGSSQHWAHLVIGDKKLFVRHGSSLMVYSLQE